jgi:hypothetical protein
MKIGDRVFVRGYIDEIRKDTVIIRNAGGYFGTIPSEVITGELPSAQPEHKDAIEKAVAVEAICDELMSRFDISATYAYEVAETAVNRIEMMAKEMGDR